MYSIGDAIVSTVLPCASPRISIMKSPGHHHIDGTGRNRGEGYTGKGHSGATSGAMDGPLALSLAITKKNSSPSLSNAETPQTNPNLSNVTLTLPLLKEGARTQLKGRLRGSDLHRVRAPTKGLESLVVEPSVKEALQQIVNHEKARDRLVG